MKYVALYKEVILKHINAFTKDLKYKSNCLRIYQNRNNEK